MRILIAKSGRVLISKIVAAEVAVQAAGVRIPATGAEAVAVVGREAKIARPPEDDAAELSLKRRNAAPSAVVLLCPKRKRVTLPLLPV